MSSGGKGNSRANTASTTNNTQTTTNAVDNRVFGEGAITLEGTGNTVNQTVTDFDALRTAGEISGDAIALGREGIISGFDFAGRGLDTAIGAVRETSKDSMDFAEFLSGRSLDTVTGLADSYGLQIADTTREAFDFADRGLTSIAGLVSGTADFADRGLTTIADLAGQNALFAERGLTEFGSFADRGLTTIADLATQGGEFARDILQDTIGGFQSLTMQTSASTDDRVAKVALYAFVAVGAAIVLPQIFKKG